MPPISRISHSGTTAAAVQRKMSVLQAGIFCVLTALVAFYLGLLLGATTHPTPPATATSTTAFSTASESCWTDAKVEAHVQAEVKRYLLQQQSKQQSSSSSWLSSKNDGGGSDNNNAPRFPTSVKSMLAGATRVPRNDFAKTFDLGVPLDKGGRGNEEVLLLYSTQSSLPNNALVAQEAASSQADIPSVASSLEATENCDYLHIVLTDHSARRKQCTAIFGQYEAFHIQKFMRLPEEKGPLDSKLPLRLVNRGAQASGRKSTAVPTLEETQNYWQILQTYLTNLEAVLKELEPLAQKVAYENTIVVQVCNFGQSELLLNFLCGAKQRGLDVSMILIFATDEETRDLLNSMHPEVTVFYDPINFADMPSSAAGRYGDSKFMKMMMAKVFCVQMVSMLGYDILFQDVDMVWFRNPVAYFHNKDADDAEFDVYFQDDGNHALYYAPYSANTGFYYVRANDRTRYFFNSFLMSGDLITGTRSHQIPLVALLQEHSSMYGLRVKIFSRDGDDFPGGHAYHRRFDLMKDIVAGRATKPQIFHMSWTTNKVNKRKFLQQMGEWYLHDKCAEKKVSDILAKFHLDSAEKLHETCCLVEPDVKCHYRDKPSKHPCKDSPPIDPGGKSFW